jgi:hypothetical protein
MSSRVKKQRRQQRNLQNQTVFTEVLRTPAMSEKQAKAQQAALAAGLPKIQAKIDDLVEEIGNLVSQLEPLPLLQMSHGWFTARSLGQDAEDQVGHAQMIALRMLDYVQSVVCGVPPSAQQRTPSNEDWQHLERLVEELYGHLSLPYFIANSAHRRINDPNHSEEVEKLRVMLQMNFVMVRSERHGVLEVPYLKRLLSPHDSVLNDLFGVGADRIAEGFERIQWSLAAGLTYAIADAKEVHRAFVENLQSHPKTFNGSTNQQVIEEFLEQSGQTEKLHNALHSMYGLGLYEVESTSGLPANLLRELAWAPGEDTEFTAPGPHSGSPVRQLPVHKRPFLHVAGKTYCFDQISLFEGLYRVIERLVKRLKPDYRGAWNEAQTKVTEQRTFELLRRLLPNAQIFTNAHYQFDSPRTGAREWAETDGVVVYAGHLFVVEVKAGLASNLSPIDHFDHHVKKMQTLLGDSARQGERFLETFRFEGAIMLCDNQHNVLETLDWNAVRHATVITVTLDGLHALSTRAAELAVLGVDRIQSPTWVLSLDNLEIYADVFRSPFRFLHFVEQRMNGEANPHTRPGDEMDHLGMYLEYNRYVDEAQRLGPEAEIIWIGQRSSVDKYYAHLNSSEPLPIPNQPQHGYFDEIVDLLEIQGDASAAVMSSKLLDVHFKHRKKIDDGVREMLRRITRGLQAPSLSLGGDTPLTVVGVPRNSGLLDTEIAVWTQRAKADMKIRRDTHRTVLFVTNGQNPMSVQLVHWVELKAEEIGEEDKMALEELSVKLRQKRIAKATEAQGYKGIGRNDQCPCGSGKKFKKCCYRLNEQPSFSNFSNRI